MTRVFMENANGDSIRIVDRKDGSALMTAISKGGQKKSWVSHDSADLVKQLQDAGFKVVEKIA